ncbi:hypothetical protein ABK040_001234 [Willaertia magna]
MSMFHTPATLVIDSQIRDWVLLPIVIFMLLFGILRHYVALMFRSSKTPPLDKLTHSQTLLKGQILSKNCNYIPQQSFVARKVYFNKENTGVFRQKIETNALSAMADPNNMTEMMKNNMQTLLPNLITFGWIYFFFSNFITAKFPFPLTDRFRAMVQRGIEIQSLETSYVTSASMYFLILFGLRGVFSLILGEGNAADDAQMMQNSNPLLMQASNPMMDYGKAFESERENLELVQHQFELHNAENELLSKWKQ